MSRHAIVAALALMTLGSSLCAQPSLEVVNAGGDLFQQVIEVPAARTPCDALTTSDGLTAPVQTLDDGRTLTILPGLFAAGERMRLTPATDAPPTDLRVETDGDSITVRNAFLGITFPRTGHGGMPTAVHYPVSGHTETAFQWRDRLYHPDRQRFLLIDDDDATARVVSEGPLQVVVETSGQFMRAGEAPGDNRATYRWTFRAHSPIVRFHARVEREDDFAWRELHILQISRKDDRLTTWAGEDQQVQSGRLQDDKTSRTFARWGALDDGENAIGLAWEGAHVIMYDGHSSYFTYLQHSARFENQQATLSGRLYVGPALEPQRYAEVFSFEPQVNAEWTAPPQGQYPPADELIELANERIALAFDRETLGCVRLRDVQRDHDFLRPAQNPATTWELTLQSADGETTQVLSDAPAQRTHELSDDGTRLTLTWREPEVAGERVPLSVTARVALPEGSQRSLWRIEVDNDSDRWSVMDVRFPRLANISEPGHPDVASPRSNWGYLHPDVRRQAGSYPGANWPMQFVSLHEDGTGLYLGYHDPRAFKKTFECVPGELFHFRTYAEDASVAGNDFRTPGPVVIGICGPSWWTAAKTYREWALQQQWTHEGPLTTRESMPDRCKDMGLWFRGGGTGEEVIRDMRHAREFFDVPIGLHWYNWHHWPFDTHYPHYFPAKPALSEAVSALVPEGMVIMPYINGRLHDANIDCFEEHVKYATKNQQGQHYVEVYGNGVEQAAMCPYTQFWQDKVAEVCERLVGEYGVNGIYLDQIGAAGPRLCYDPGHGHPLGGGGWWVDSYRTILNRVQEIAHRGDRDVVITTENNAEPYMDGVDCFLIWNPRHPNEIPISTAVYSGYTLYFASNARCAPGLQPFAMIEGRDFIWGSQLGWMTFDEVLSGERAEYFRRLVRLRHSALKYVVYGELLGEVRPASEPPTVTGIWHARDASFDAELPAVMATVWRGSDGSLGLLMANLSGRPQALELDFETERFGDIAGDGDALLLREITPEGASPCGFAPSMTLERTEMLPAWGARVIELTRVPSAAEVQVPAGAASDALDRFGLDAWAARAGVTWSVDLPAQEVAAGDELTAAVTVTGDARPEVVLDAGGRQLSARVERQADGSLRAAPALQIEQKPGATLEGTLTVRFDEQHALTMPWSATVVDRLQVEVEPVGGGVPAGEATAVRVTLRNRATAPVASGTRVVIDAPEGWRLWPGRAMTFGDLPAGGRRERFIRCDVPREAPAGRASITAAIVASEDAATVETLPPRPRIDAHRLSPTIDGDLTEWRELQPIVLAGEEALNIEGHAGPDDLSARCWLAADERRLYFAADVTDDTHWQPNQDETIWAADAVQLAIRPGSPPRRPGFTDVTELGLALTPGGPFVWRWMPDEGAADSVELSVVREGTHTRYEMAVDLSALGIVGEPGSRVAAFSLTVNESDGDGFDGWLELTGGICGGKDASQFAALHF